jgi:flagellar basal body-associated protein FliL
MIEYILLLIVMIALPLAAVAAVLMWFVRSKTKGGGEGRPPSPP